RTVEAQRVIGRLCQTSVICSHGSVSRHGRISRPPTGRWPQAIVPIILLICGVALAQTPDNIAEREMQRRQAAIPEGEAALARGKSALKTRNYTVAYQEFKTAICSPTPTVFISPASTTRR